MPAEPTSCCLVAEGACLASSGPCCFSHAAIIMAPVYTVSSAARAVKASCCWATGTQPAQGTACEGQEIGRYPRDSNSEMQHNTLTGGSGMRQSGPGL
jgi:hypothetical protein